MNAGTLIRAAGVNVPFAPRDDATLRGEAPESSRDTRMTEVMARAARRNAARREFDTLTRTP